MRYFLILKTLIWLLFISHAAAQTKEDEYWQQYVHYTIDVSLDTSAHSLQGTEKIFYQNNSPDTLYNFYLHLYPNAFNDPNSTLVKEAKKHFVYRNIPKEDRGYIKIQEFKIISSAGRTSDLPLAAFYVEDTVLRLTLPEPLPPAGTLEFELKFFEKIRKYLLDSGYRGQQYDMRHWYPKVAVYDENGWNREPFHLLGGYYGEFGTFDVTLNLPGNYIVAATGVPVAGDPGWDWVQVDTTISEAGWKIKSKQIRDRLAKKAKDQRFRKITFHAEKVHDFAWTASPNFLYERGEWNGTPIHVLYQTQSKKEWSKTVIRRGVRALRWLSQKFAPYPYPQLTITQGLIDGGVKNPMIVMMGSEAEWLVTHLVGHIYFYAILGVNEQKEAWLDEGFNTFQTQWYMEKRYGRLGFNKEEFLKNAPKLLKLYPLPSIREFATNFTNRYLRSGHNEPIAQSNDEFKDLFGYGMNAYLKGAFFFDMLQYVVGEENFDKIGQVYFKRWAFKHVNEARFKQVSEEVSGMDLDWFFEQWLHGTATVEYALGEIKKFKQADGTWRTEVEVQRKDQGVMPVEVVVETKDGQKLVQRWDGQEEKQTLVFETQEKPKTVLMDPKDKILDNNRLNNGGSRFEFKFDLPLLDAFYAPRSAYLILWRPFLDYNGIDRFRPGLRFRGSYLQEYNKLTVGIWYGTKSKELDGMFRFSNPLRSLGGQTRYDLAIEKTEGRLIGNAHLAFRFSNNLSTPPVHLINFGYDFSKLLNSAYVFRELAKDDDPPDFREWDDGKVGKLYLTYSVNPRGLWWRSFFAANFESAGEFLGGDFDYHKLFGEARYKIHFKNFDLSWRGFGGIAFGPDDPPTQERFFVEGANPRARFETSFLRSKGGFPTGINYHKFGGGNLRGYFDQPLGGEKLVSLNVQLERKIFGPIKFAGFYDTGKVWPIGTQAKTLSDAGVGLHFWFNINAQDIEGYSFNIDFPLWLSDPLPGEKEFKFRWLVGFNQSF
jgi:hypothetical protein